MRALSADVILPQHDAEPMLKGQKPFDPQFLFQNNLDSIERATVLVAILDGPDADSGTCWECGYAFRMGRPIVGLRTDIRSGGDDPKAPLNLMLSMCCSSIVIVPADARRDVGLVAERVLAAVRNAVAPTK